MEDKQVSVKEDDIKEYLKNHLNSHWKDIVNAVANSNNGSNIFSKFKHFIGRIFKHFIGRIVFSRGKI